MPIPTTNVRFSAIQTEFGGSNPIAFSEYYRGGSYVPSNQPDAGYGLIATSGAISVGPFRGQTKVRTYSAMNGFNYYGIVNDGTTEAYINMNVDPVGLYYMTYNNANGNPFWTNPTQINIGNTHWIRVDITSSTGGGTFSGTTGSYLQISTTRTFRFAQTGLAPGGQSYRRVRIRISTNSSGTAVVADGQSNWYLQR